MLILIKPNRRNHNLISLLQDDSPLIQHLREHQLKTPEHLFHDQIKFRELSKFTSKSGGKVNIGNTILSEGLDTSPSIHYSHLTHFLFGKLYFGITEGRSILFRTLLYHHRDLWYPCQLSKYSPSNDIESSCAYI